MKSNSMKRADWEDCRSHGTGSVESIMAPWTRRSPVTPAILRAASILPPRSISRALQSQEAQFGGKCWGAGDLLSGISRDWVGWGLHCRSNENEWVVYVELRSAWAGCPCQWCGG